MVQEFHLSVTPISDDENRYYVRVERVEQGVPLAEEQVVWPVEDWLAQARQVFTDPLSEFFQSSPEDPYEVIPVDPLSSASGSPSEPALIALGQTMYNALFQGTVRDSWVTAQGVAQNRQERLRLRLGLKGERLMRLPWEVLHAGNRPIAAATDVVFSRYQGKLNTLSAAGARFAAQPSLPSSLHILMVLAAPTDQVNLELKREALQLKEELQRHRSSDSQGALPEIQLTLLEHPGREELTQILEQAPYQVFHFAGHSSPGPSGGRLHLVNSRNGLTESLNGDDLAGLLANNGIQLAVLNSCLGTQASTSNEFDLQGERTLAEALIRRGIPGVLAMAERIPDQVALTLSRLFYRNLKFGQPLDLSLCRARQGLISAYGSNQLYWALPILYLHSDFGGRLVRPTPGWQETGPFQEEPLLAGMDAGNYRGGGAAAIAIPTEELEDPFAFPEDEPPLFDPQDPQMTHAVTRLEQDFMGEGLGTSRPLTDPLVTGGDGAVVGEGADAGRAVSSGAAIAPNTPADHLQPNSHEGQPLGAHSPQSAAASGGTSVGEQQPKERSDAAKIAWPTAPSQKQAAWLIAGATGLLLLAAGVWGIAQKNRGPVRLLGGDSPAELANQTTDELLNEAFIGVGNQDLAQSNQALEALLEQGALDKATNVVGGLSQSLLDQASPEERYEAQFLRGRLNWQQFAGAQVALLDPASTDSGMVPEGVDPRESEAYLSDAHLQWLNLVQEAPENLRYRNAYALSLWAKGQKSDLLKARELLRENLELFSEQSATKNEQLETYANLALVAMKLAKAGEAGENTELWDEAANFYRTVTDSDARSYNPKMLNGNFERFWMWTPLMIEDWQELSGIAAGDR